MNIKDKLQEVFRDVFDDETVELFDEMTSKDIEDWDSLNHIILIREIEHSFNITFTTEELVRLKNVGEIIEVINSKLRKN